MTLNDVYMLAGIVGAIIASIYGLLKFIFTSLDKHRDDVEKRFVAHAGRLDKNEKAIGDNDKTIRKLTDEVHKDYVRKTEHDRDYEALGKMVSDNFAAVFHKVDAIARDLNRLIGKTSGSNNNSVASPDDQ